MHRHLIAVEICVVCRTNKRMNLDRISFDEHWLESLDTHSMECWSTIQKHWMILRDLFENVPDFGSSTLKHSLGTLDRVCKTMFLQLADNERLEQFKRDLLWKSALPEFQFWSDDDDRPRRIINALAEQILAESTLLTFDHVRDGLERTIARTEHWSSATTVVKQRIDCLLQHSFFVADDDFWCIEIHQLLQAIISVDDASIEIVQIACGKVAALKQNEWAKLRRDHWDHIENHPLWFIGRSTNLLDQLQSLREILCFLLALCLIQFHANFCSDCMEIEQVRGEEFANGFCAHHGGEFAAVLGNHFAIFIVCQDLLEFKICGTWIGHNIILEVDDLFDVASSHTKQRSESTWKSLEEPDVNCRCSEIDVSHALSSHTRMSHLHAATVADDSFVLGSLVLAAGAFIITLWSEDPFAEQTVPFGAVGSIVDGFWFLDFAEAPASDVIRARELNANRSVVIDTIENAFCHAVHSGSFE